MATKREPIYIKQPGRKVGAFGVQAKGHKPGDFNPLVLTWTVAKYRKSKDLNTVIDQGKARRRLPKYEASLFESCFKNWG